MNSIECRIHTHTPGRPKQHTASVFRRFLDDNQNFESK